MFGRDWMRVLGLGPLYFADEAEEPAGEEPEGPEVAIVEGSGAGEADPEYLAEIKAAVEARKAERETPPEPGPSAEDLPDGWYRDGDNRLRNEKGDYAKLPTEEKPAAPAAEGEEEEEPTPEEKEALEKLLGKEEGEDEQEPGAEGEEEEEAEGEGKPVTVQLPGRRPEDEAVEIEVDDPVVAETLNRLRNGYMRGEQARAVAAEAEELQEELETVAAQVRSDPIGFVLSGLPKQHRGDVVRAVLATDEELLASITEELTDWHHDENLRARAMAEIKLRRREMQDTAAREAAAVKEVVQASNAITQRLRGLIPEDMDESRAARFYDDALRDLTDYAEKHPKTLLTADQAIELLNQSGRLAMYGLDPEGSATAPTPGASTNGSEAPAPGAAADEKEVEKARQTGARLKKGRERRRAAASTAPAGAGASPAKLSPPAGQGVKERIDWLKGKMGLS